jgi:hypothetical protein
MSHDQQADSASPQADNEIETIGFPIEDDELYQLFTEGRASAYQELQTKAKYGWR